MEIADQRYERGGNYRSDFFNAAKPFWRNYYFCIYCGRLVSKRKLQVDHIIPVHKAKTSWMVKKILDVSKMEKGVNDPRNLGASCPKCNLMKGSKMGLWVIRGRIGKSNAFQIFRWMLRFVLMGLMIYFMYETKMFQMIFDVIKNFGTKMAGV